ncbi:MAG: hypothetical protein M5T61_16900 [Acidimicrobiia bacterium]|nr:hypothetical protein [Acidimicrobiia bacterium]
MTNAPVRMNEAALLRRPIQRHAVSSPSCNNGASSPEIRTPTTPRAIRVTPSLDGTDLPRPSPIEQTPSSAETLDAFPDPERTRSPGELMERLVTALDEPLASTFIDNG